MPFFLVCMSKGIIDKLRPVLDQIVCLVWFVFVCVCLCLFVFVCVCLLFHHITILVMYHSIELTCFHGRKGRTWDSTVL